MIPICQMPQGHPSHCGCSQPDVAFNTSVNIQSIGRFKREPATCGVTTEVIDFDRYLVVKLDNLSYLSQHKRTTLLDLVSQITDARRAAGLKPQPKRVVISESMDCYATVVDLVSTEIRNKSGVNVLDRLIRTPSSEDLLLVAKTFMGSRVHLNPNTANYNGAELLIPDTHGSFRDGELVPWNPWNNPHQALELSVHVRARLGCDENGPHVEYWDLPLTHDETGGDPDREVMRTVSCMQHEESGFSLAFARKLTQVAVYRAHRIQGTI